MTTRPKATSRSKSPGITATAIPADAPPWFGALMYLALLAYPGPSSKDDDKRNQVIAAWEEWLRGYHVYHQADQQRTSARRRAAAPSQSWLAQPATMERAKMLRTLNGAAVRIVRRCLCAQAVDYVSMFTSRRKPSLTQMGPWVNDMSARRFWKLWRETLPVLHMATAIRGAVTRPPNEGERPDLFPRLMNAHAEWFPAALDQSEFQAEYVLPSSVERYDPEQRIRLIAGT